MTQQFQTEELQCRYPLPVDEKYSLRCGRCPACETFNRLRVLRRQQTTGKVVDAGSFRQKPIEQSEREPSNGLAPSPAGRAKNRAEMVREILTDVGFVNHPRPRRKIFWRFIALLFEWGFVGAVLAVLAIVAVLLMTTP